MSIADWTRVSRRDMLSLFGCASLVGVAGCIDDPPVEEPLEYGEHHLLGDEREEVEVKMGADRQSEFRPYIVHVVSGGTVVWVLEHNVHDTAAFHPDHTPASARRIPESAEPWNSDYFDDSGETFEWTFSEPGVYDYFCTPHKSDGMVGRVVVGDPDLSSETAMGTPDDSLSDAVQYALEVFNETTEEVLQ